MRNLPGFALAALSLLGLAPAQAPATGVSVSEVLGRFGLTSGSVQQIPWTVDPGGVAQFTVELDGTAHTVAVHRHELLVDDYQLLVDFGAGPQPVAIPAVDTFRGSVVGVAGSAAAVTAWDGRVHALVSIGDLTWGIEPVPLDVAGATAGSHVVYRSDAAIASAVNCGGGVDVAGLSGPWIGLDGPSVPRECEIAIDCDVAFFGRNNNDVATTQNAAVAILNGVDTIYQRDTGICYAVTAVVVRTVSVYTSGQNLGCSGSGLLQEMRTYWQANHASIPRDTAHLMSGLGTYQGTIGCAFNNVVCTWSGYGVSRPVSSNLTSNVRLVCHELGHNWSAPHCDGQSPCRIMCSNLSGCSGGASFSAASAQLITGFRDTRTCLGNCSSCATAASYGYFGQPCAGSAVQLSHSGTPVIGGSFTLQVSAARPFSTAALLWGGQSAIADLTSVGAPGCTLYVSNVFHVLSQSTDVFGRATWNLQLPSSAGLCGVVVPQQAVVIDPTANALQIVTTARGILTFGI
ncbi:MAG: hypothetical protein KDB80_18535 [Planctomycetes bacterium]|nr:hypothetical protein [Planctomycetota bacterium]